MATKDRKYSYLGMISDNGAVKYLLSEINVGGIDNEISNRDYW